MTPRRAPSTRRAFLGGLAAGALVGALPRPVRAAVPRLIWFSTGERRSAEGFLDALRDGLHDHGYEDRRNLVIETRWGDTVSGREEQMASEILASRPALVVTQGRAGYTMAQMRPTVPVVFGFSGDPVEGGLVASLARPGGNLTGITFLAYDLVGKRIEILKQALPGLRRLAAVASPEHVGQAKEFAASKAAGERLGIAVSNHPARNPAELEAALADARSAHAEGLIVFPDPLTNARRELIADFALRHRLPAVSGWSNYADAGLLLTYGPHLRESWRRLAYFVDRVLRGAKPSELPVELPRTVELVLNLRTARALGVTVPPALVARADRTID